MKLNNWHLIQRLQGGRRHADEVGSGIRCYKCRRSCNYRQWANGSCVEEDCAGENVGTLFLPKEEKLTSRKRWIGYTIKPKGKIYVDDGAMCALLEKGKSLLASGIVAAEGAFGKGDIVSVCKREDRDNFLPGA